MILWIVLLVIIIIIAFLLAFASMRDFRTHVNPEKDDYAPFLIRNKKNLNLEVLNFLHTAIYKTSLIFSIERLFKGSESALVIFGPKHILIPLTDNLDLIELEDYSGQTTENTVCWEIGTKVQELTIPNNFFANLPKFLDNEQFWWQIVLQPAISKKEKIFNAQIRIVYLFSDQLRKEKLLPMMQSFGGDILVKVPKPFTTAQLLEFYQKRSFGKEEFNPVLSFENTLKLSWVI